jgi:phospho-N-acetylmuramoyl-pentapeptide-transferase
MFVVNAEVNAVNLTDGLDGLASGVTLIYALAMALIFSLMSAMANELGQVYYSANLGGMAVFCAAVVGACLGFLRFNAYPARVFMGDTGSMALGGAVSMMAICSRAVLLLPIMGACFVASAVSVVLQVGSYKLRRKRIFKMAPLHHHFELKGVPAKPKL